MLSDKRIEIAKRNVKMYEDEGLLKAAVPDKNILSFFMKNSKESLLVADFLSEKNMSPLWVIVCSYYSMYYMSNAVLYSMGYKVGHKISHKVTSDALIAFVRPALREKLIEDYEESMEEALAGLKADELVENFDFERMKRSLFQYEMGENIKKNKSQTSLKRAKEFIFEMQKLIR